MDEIEESLAAELDNVSSVLNTEQSGRIIESMSESRMENEADVSVLAMREKLEEKKKELVCCCYILTFSYDY